MTRISNPLYAMALISVILCSSISPSLGQEKINVAVGVGFPELINVGVRYQLSQVQIGVGAGFLPNKDERAISFSADVFAHFAGESSFSARRPWYGRIGLNYAQDEDKYMLEKYLFLCLRIGRDLNISKKIGIQIDGGLTFKLFNEETDKVPPSGWDVGPDFDSGVMPGLGIAFFYRI